MRSNTMQRGHNQFYGGRDGGSESVGGNTVCKVNECPVVAQRSLFLGVKPLILRVRR